MQANKQTRSYDWQLPSFTPSDFAELSGLALLQRMIAGELPAPPIMATLDYTLTQVEYGRVEAEGVPAAWAYNPLGSIHGGYTATLLDTVVACAVHSTLAAGFGYTTLELKLNYTRPLLATTGRVRAIGKVLHRGGRIATAEGQLIAIDTGKLYAHATTTALIMAFGEKAPDAK